MALYVSFLAKVKIAESYRRQLLWKVLKSSFRCFGMLRIFVAFAYGPFQRGFLSFFGSGRCSMMGSSLTSTWNMFLLPPG